MLKRLLLSAFLACGMCAGLAAAPTPVFASTLPTQNHAALAGNIIPRLPLVPQTYCVTVQPGDWLSKLFPSNWQSVAVANSISNPNLIFPGQRICDAGTANTVSYTTYKPAVTYSGGSPNHYPYGWCTYGAAALAWDNVDYLGNAKDWIWNARARGMPTGSTPRVGATVVFQAYVQGASYLGHVAHVTAVYGNGSFQVREMNNTYLGGFGIYNYNVYWVGVGVSFIY